MATLQVRDIDTKLYDALRIRAKADHRSISQEIVYILEDHLAKTSITPTTQTQLFMSLSGAWTGNETAKEIISSIRSSRKQSTRFRGKNVSFD
jgi:hypothetical protein